MIEEFEMRNHYEHPTPSVSFTNGPDRIVTDKPDPDFKPRPVGFITKEETDD